METLVFTFAIGLWLDYSHKFVSKLIKYYLTERKYLLVTIYTALVLVI